MYLVAGEDMPPSQRRPGHTIDLSACADLIEAALLIIKEHDGNSRVTLDPDLGGHREGRVSNQYQAKISRDLLRLSALLGAAASEVDLAYWELKGHQDPRYQDE